MSLKRLVVAITAFLAGVVALNNGLARTPPLGFNGYNAFSYGIFVYKAFKPTPLLDAMVPKTIIRHLPKVSFRWASQSLVITDSTCE